MRILISLKGKRAPSSGDGLHGKGSMMERVGIRNHSLEIAVDPRCWVVNPVDQDRVLRFRWLKDHGVGVYVCKYSAIKHLCDLTFEPLHGESIPPPELLPLTIADRFDTDFQQSKIRGTLHLAKHLSCHQSQPHVMQGRPRSLTDGKLVLQE